LRDKAGLPGLWVHDLRHTVITELAEMGVPDAVLESISGHLSKRLLDHDSHLRLDGKRKALDGLEEVREQQAAAEAVATAAHEQGETVQ
jgi:integrase